MRNLLASYNITSFLQTSVCVPRFSVHPFIWRREVDVKTYFERLSDWFVSMEMV